MLKQAEASPPYKAELNTYDVSAWTHRSHPQSRKVKSTPLNVSFVRQSLSVNKMYFPNNATGKVEWAVGWERSEILNAPKYPLSATK